MSIKLVILTNIAASAFGADVPEEARTAEWVAFTSDDEGYLIAGRNRDGDSAEDIVAHFDADEGFAGFIAGGLPLELFGIMNGTPFLSRETLGEDVSITELKVYGEEDDVDFSA